MPRIVGVDIPNEKRLDVALTYIFGIGATSAKKIVAELGGFSIELIAGSAGTVRGATFSLRARRLGDASADVLAALVRRFRVREPTDGPRLLELARRSFRFRDIGEHAYRDMKYLDFDVPFGMFMRNMHRWAAHAMVIMVWLHMVRVFLTGSYKPPRQFNWVIGVFLLVLTMLLSFTAHIDS